MIFKLWFERKKTLTLFEKFDCREDKNVDSAKKMNAKYIVKIFEPTVEETKEWGD